MAYDILDFYNFVPKKENQEALRLAMMFKEEVDEAVRAYMELLQIAIESSGDQPVEINQVFQQAITAALITGLRAYRGWMLEQGIDVRQVEEDSGKDIPPNFYHADARWPL